MTTDSDLPESENVVVSDSDSDSDSDAEPTSTADPVESASGRKEVPVVVGIGASAGGLEALEHFFRNLPVDTGLAFVVVTHQHLGHASMMPELLGRQTLMPVAEVTAGTVVQANHVYIAPPGIPIALMSGELQLMAEESAASARLPIDYFFRSLALDLGEKAVGIVLSGTGSDGSLGLKEIKSQAGMSMAQAEDSARYPGMPRSAIATGQVDFVLSVEELPAKLLEFVAGVRDGGLGEQARLASHANELRKIMILLRQRTNHDFSNYKITTIRRRIQRRMNLHGLELVSDYVRFLHSNPAEVETLFQELLINVTSFFRDPEAFEFLATDILPEIVKGKATEDAIRIWIPGCSTGEEAYSIAMLLREVLDTQEERPLIQIFATDLDPEAIETARMAKYPEGIAQDITPERLNRFFTRTDLGYAVNKDLREMVVFAPQNLLQDPPFTKVDLISCRNLLIYLDSSLQSRLFPIFHYSLRKNGVLFLGNSESIGHDVPLFCPINKRWKFFRRNEVPAHSYDTKFPASVVPHSQSTGGPGGRVSPVVRELRADVTLQTDRLLINELVPPTVLCDGRGDIMHIHGKTGDFLELVPGPQTTNNLFSMARDALQLDVAAAVHQAAGTTADIVHRAVRFDSGSETLLTDLHVRPLQEPAHYRGLFLVSFENTRPSTLESSEEQGGAHETEESRSRTEEILRELQHTKAVHQGTVEELQTSNEELKSMNEELQSTNEELQSTNEELETSKEEMQSLNEELHTVNAELQAKLGELARVNDDMHNLLNGTDIATIFLDNDLCIKRYTEQVKRVANLIPGDIGRPLADLVSRVSYRDLIADAEEVLRTLVFQEVEVQGPEETWYQVRIVPYRTTENVIDGLVMTFVDITKVKRVFERERQMAIMLKAASICVFGNDLELRYRWASEPEVLGNSLEDIIGQRDSEFLSVQNAKELERVKQQALDTGRAVREAVSLEIDGRERRFDLRAQPLLDNNDAPIGLVCALSVRPLGPSD